MMLRYAPKLKDYYAAFLDLGGKNTYVLQEDPWNFHVVGLRSKVSLDRLAISTKTIPEELI